MFPNTHFDPTRDDPVDFDKRILMLLGEKYEACLATVVSQLSQPAWLSRPLEEFARSTANWSILKRQLVLGFCVAEAMGFNPLNLVTLWEGYARARILPLCALDDAMDKDLPVRSDPYVVVSYAIAALLKGHEFFSNHPEILPFWKVLRDSVIRIASAVHFQLSIRFDTTYLDNPISLLSLYETQHSPFRRSSSFVTYVYGLGAIKGLNITTDTPWQFERFRQLLDDIADLREDLPAGRLTYPALLTINDVRLGPQAKTIVQDLWNNKQNKGEWWPPFRRCLLEAGVLDHLKQQVTADLTAVSDWISTSLPGDCEPLLALIEAKRAFLYRLIQRNLEDTPPSSPLDSIGETA
jgi:hypothetical protein